MTSRPIPPSTVTALRELLVRMMHDESGGDADAGVKLAAEVRHALRALCDDARAHELRVEQIVVAIKQGWSSLHSEHPRARSDGPDTLLNQVITVCIDEYYAERSPG